MALHLPTPLAVQPSSIRLVVCSLWKALWHISVHPGTTLVHVYVRHSGITPSTSAAKWPSGGLVSQAGMAGMAGMFRIEEVPRLGDEYLAQLDTNTEVRLWIPF